MEIITETPYVFLPFDCTPAPSLPALSLIVKGTFKLRPEQAAIALPKNKQQPMAGDDMHMDELGRSLRYANDLVPLKTRGEATLSAVCYTSDGRPRASCDVAIAIGPIQKALRVTGDRAWVRDAQGAAVIGRTQPFESMPLRWERAFGGMNLPQNPLGRGAEPAPDDAGKMVHALPNVEYLDKRVVDIKDRPPAAGVGPVSPMWEPRLKRQGTRDQRWAMFVAPLPPKDLDPLYFNAAPDDQQLREGFFRGDEAIVMTGLHKQLPVYRSSLPCKRLRVFLQVRKPPRDGVPQPSAFNEVDMQLDTVHIDMETEELVVIWRRPVKTQSRAHPELEAVYIVEEDLASEPLPIDVHRARFLELKGPKADPSSVAIQAEIEAQRAEVSKVLRDSNLDPKAIEKIEATKDPQEMFRLVMDIARDKIRELEAMTEAMKP